jgi:hypothetical protein
LRVIADGKPSRTEELSAPNELIREERDFRRSYTSTARSGTQS